MLHAATISMHQLAHVTIAILVLGANCYSSGIQNVPRGEDGTAPKINGFVSSLYSCLHSGRKPEQCHVNNAGSVRSISGSVQPSRSRDRISVHIRFETKQLQSTANNVVAELRVYKNSLPMRAIARMMVAGCYSSDVIVGLQVASGEVVSRLVLSARDLATSSWVPFHNLSGLYNGWVQNQSEQEMILKIAILSGSCNSNRVVLNAFASPFAEHHSPVLLLYSNDSTNDLQARNVDSSSPNRLAAANDHRLARDVAPGACRLQFHHVNLSDYFHDIVEPSQYSISYCAGTCDSAPDVGTRTWVLFSEHQRDPSTFPPLCCVPERYTSLTVLVQRDDTTFLETLLNFAAKSCHCV